MFSERESDERVVSDEAKEMQRRNESAILAYPCLWSFALESGIRRYTVADCEVSKFGLTELGQYGAYFICIWFIMVDIFFRGQ